MKIIFAQGNPGSDYQSTRHNVGFDLLDRFVTENGGSWTEKAKFSAYICEIPIENEKIICVKPTTFYNETGSSARKIIDFYKVDPASDFLVIHDELALPFGTVRVRSKGSDAGNNGIKNLNAHIGENYHRIRIGVQNDHYSGDDVSFVLGRFDKDEAAHLATISQTVGDLIHSFVKNELEHASRKIELSQ